MKKSLLVLPMIALLAACGGGSGSATPKGKQVDLLENKETLLGAASSLKTVLDTLSSKRVLHLNGEVSKGNLEVNLNVSGQNESGAQDSAKVNLAVKNVNGKLDAALIGYNFSEEGFSSNDLKAYAELSGLGAELHLDYKLPDAMYQESEDMDQTTAMIAAMVAQSGKVDVKASGINAAVYLDEGNVYADVSDEKIYTLLDGILDSGILPSLAEVDSKSLITMLLSMVAKEEVTYNGKIGFEGVIPEQTLYGSIPNLDFSEMITDETFPQIKDMVAPILEALKIKTYVYGDTSEYSYGFEFNLNKTTLNAIMGLAGAEVSLDDVLTQYGIKLNKFENKLSLNLRRDGGLKVTCELSNDMTVKPSLGEGAPTINASLKLSGKGDLEVSFDNTFKALPSFADYLLLDLRSEEEPEPVVVTE